MLNPERSIKKNKNNILHNNGELEILKERVSIIERQLNCDGFHGHYWVNMSVSGMHPLRCKHCGLIQTVSGDGKIKYGY